VIVVLAIVFFSFFLESILESMPCDAASNVAFPFRSCVALRWLAVLFSTALRWHLNPVVIVAKRKTKAGPSSRCVVKRKKKKKKKKKRPVFFWLGEHFFESLFFFSFPPPIDVPWNEFVS